MQQVNIIFPLFIVLAIENRVKSDKLYSLALLQYIYFLAILNFGHFILGVERSREKFIYLSLFMLTCSRARDTCIWQTSILRAFIFSNGEYIIVARSTARRRYEHARCSSKMFLNPRVRLGAYLTREFRHFSYSRAWTTPQTNDRLCLLFTQWNIHVTQPKSTCTFQSGVGSLCTRLAAVVNIYF